ncbi:MAG: GGDEF domain-containing protein [Ilumatobacter sp.]|uniref:GGDEF domain-containing protein n=1 Tax=Ilumatobacter sp. TaxID=1967498 RepID=UPI002601D10C|nr:GGDEF domain-containing protein [Ilumatobacter sp.]MDJ0771163.1 GGDEF domain-containing protein [Ilumatobacter sp.]
MLKFGHSLVVATAVLVVPSVAVAAVDSTDAVSDLATEAAELIAEEQALIELADPASDQTATDRTTARAQLRTVDARAAALLDQFEQLDVELTETIRLVMAPLPDPEGRSAQELATLTPPGVVYDAAIDDLLRIAATPAAVTPVTDGSSSRSFGLLAVAAFSLLVLGLAALTNTLRRRPSTDELAAMAWSDGLTGLANRRRFDHDLRTTDEQSVPTAVIMLDVDHFKIVNDTYGHRVGDETLCAVSAMLSRHVRRDDVVYRYGGEEFCVLLSNATTQDAQIVAERIVEAARMITLPDGAHITVSVGVADAVAGAVTDAVQVADRALYAAKELGRDQVVSAPDRKFASI